MRAFLDILDTIMGKGRSVFLILIGLLISYRLVRQVDHDFIFDNLINSVIVIVGITVLVWNIIKDMEDFKQNRLWKAFLSSIAGFSIIIVLSATLFLLRLRDRSPVKMNCVAKIVDFNGVSIDFRVDGTYKLTSWCLGSDNHRGQYIMHDSVILLDKNEIGAIIKSNKLLIRADGEKDSLGNIEKSVYQMDENGQIIAHAIDFRIINKRK